jgi:hypothetical protein
VWPYQIISIMDSMRRRGVPTVVDRCSCGSNTKCAAKSPSIARLPAAIIATTSTTRTTRTTHHIDNNLLITYNHCRLINYNINNNNSSSKCICNNNNNSSIDSRQGRHMDAGMGHRRRRIDRAGVRRRVRARRRRAAKRRSRRPPRPRRRHAQPRPLRRRRRRLIAIVVVVVTLRLATIAPLNVAAKQTLSTHNVRALHKMIHFLFYLL